ncbi:MAG: tRNA uridine-5-carboxymethylaminomethyl(34) synthesis GTPase MnmE [Hyphomicrobiales bacterium]|nr:tRNA uridine-5-carboxymethylaminomethyl(34) synthesis GTPase MnmE [Hyphomicrobiales bacterium]
MIDREATYCRIIDPDNDDLIDTGIVLFFAAPGSFTGEDCAEFQVHGSPAVIKRLIRSLACFPKTRLAEPGEFIRRAFENGKMALTSVEGVADLIDARTEAQRKQALAQAGGHLADESAKWRELLLEALAFLDAEIDFSDEGEAPTGVVSQVLSLCRLLLSQLEAALADAGRSERVRSGYRVVIAGLPNAGKSSLMNALVRRDVTIVTEHPGTTRDIIEVEFDLNGFSIVVCDTAGVRETVDPVEKIGVARTRAALRSADLIIWLADARGEAPQLDSGTPALIVASKMDLVASMPEWADVGMSIGDENRIEALKQRVAELAAAELAGEPPLITNERHRMHIENAARQLSGVMAIQTVSIELLAEDIRRCAITLSALSGNVGTEDVLGAIFSRFCMGK